MSQNYIGKPIRVSDPPLIFRRKNPKQEIRNSKKYLMTEIQISSKGRLLPCVSVFRFCHLYI